MDALTRRLSLVMIGLAALSGRVEQPAAPGPLVPIDAIAAIVDAFRAYPIVGLSAGEGHGDLRGPAFVKSLIRDPRFPSVANDIVMEGATARYQDAMDRYVRGEDVPVATLRRVWDETTQQQVPGPMWTGEVPAVYRAAREVNAKLPRERQVRVLLADPPIEWENVHTAADFRKWLERRDSHAAEMIQREVVAKGRRALLVYGGGHLQRRQVLTNYQMDDPLAQTVISLLERAGVRTFIVRTTTDRDGWRVPSVALLEGTAYGVADEPISDTPRVAIRDGKLVPIPRDQWITIPRQEQTDALLYLGPSSERTEAPVTREICSDRAYVDLRLRRMALAGLPPSEPARLKQLCGL